MSHVINSTMFTIREAAQYLGVSKGTVRNEIKRGRILAKRFAKRVIRIAQTELDRYIKARDEIVYLK